MYKGIYITLSGAVTKQDQIDIIAQNIANANTSGYKKERLAFKDFLILADNKPSFMPDERVMSEISSTMVDFSNGAFVKTGNPLDLAISGKGFFALEGNKYTRGGNFKINSEGYITTQDDMKVLGSGGPILVKGKKIEVSSEGEIFVDGASVDTLKLIEFSNKENLQRLNGGIFTTNEAGEEIKSQVEQGYLEASNIDVVKEMVQMIMALRDYEAYQKMIQGFDEATGKVVNEMGK